MSKLLGGIALFTFVYVGLALAAMILVGGWLDDTYGGLVMLLGLIGMGIGFAGLLALIIIFGLKYYLSRLK